MEVAQEQGKNGCRVCGAISASGSALEPVTLVGWDATPSQPLRLPGNLGRVAKV